MQKISSPGFSLFRSRGDRKLAGVCGGLGESTGADPVFFRILFFLAATQWYVAVIIYLVFWWILPER